MNPFDQFDAPAGNPFDQFDSNASPQPSNGQAAPTQLHWYDRLAKGINDVNTAGAQMLVHSLPSGVVNAVNSATQYVNDLPVVGPVTKALGMTPATPQQLDQQISQNEQKYQNARQASGNNGVDWMRLGGNIAATAPLAATIPGADGFLGGAASGILYNGISQPVTSGNYGPEKTKQMMLSGLLGGATSKALGAASNLISPNVSPDIQTLVDSGVTPTPGQILGGGYKRVEDAATSVPVLGDYIKNAQLRTLNDFNVAALNKSGVNVSEGGQAGIEQARKIFNQKYDDILGQMKLNPDPGFENSVLQVATQNRLSPDGIKELTGMIQNDYVPKFENLNGVPTMSGNEIKAFDMQLRQNANSFLRSQDPMQQRIGQAYNDLRQAFKDTLSAQNPPGLVSALQQTDRDFASFAQYRNASVMANALKNGGMVTPSQYMNSVASMAKQSGRAIPLSEGNALNQDFASAANNVMGNAVPDSGTPFRHAIQAGIGALAGHSVLPAEADAMLAPVAVGIGGASLPYTKIGQKLAAQLLTKRPDYAPQIAGAVRSMVPYSGLLAAQLANGGGN
jgi:hypothetical protein